MPTDALDMLYEPSNTDYSYDPRLMLCTGCQKENTRCENCGAKLRTDGVDGLAIEMRPCGNARYAPDEHTAERCKNRRERALDEGLLPSAPKLEETSTARLSPETFNY